LNSIVPQPKRDPPPMPTEKQLRNQYLLTIFSQDEIDSISDWIDIETSVRILYEMRRKPLKPWTFMDEWKSSLIPFLEEAGDCAILDQIEVSPPNEPPPPTNPPPPPPVPPKGELDPFILENLPTNFLDGFTFRNENDCTLTYWKNYTKVAFELTFQPEGDLRPDSNCHGDSKHGPIAVIAVITTYQTPGDHYVDDETHMSMYTHWYNKFANYMDWKIKHVRRLEVSFELLCQALSQANISYLDSEEVNVRKLKRAIQTNSTVNVNKYGVLSHDPIADNTTLIATYYLRRRYQLMTKLKLSPSLN
jgi:hypothetical protein